VPPKVVRRRLPDMLLEQGLITQEQLQECIALHRSTGESLARILVKQKYVSEEDLVITLSEQLGIPHIRLAHYNIPKEVLDEVPESLARQYQMLPVSVTGDVLTLAMADPLNLQALDDLRMLTSHDIEPVVAVQSELLAAIDRHYGGGKAEEMFDELLDAQEIADGGSIEEVRQGEEDVEDVSVLEAGSEDGPIKKLVRLVVLNALEAGASDIHIEPFEKLLRVRYRIDGTLEEVKGPPKSLQSKLIARFKILSNCKIDESRLPQDGRMRMRYKGRDIDFRVAYLPCRYGEKIVLRVLDKGNLTLDLDTLGFEEQPMAAFKHAMALPNGMVLVTGPTGGGKTTTLYSALHKLNEIGTNVVTVEDPIEYELFGVNQVETKAQIGLTFAECLRQILRQDPDIVMVGEIRDQETADVAVKAALTGHLVLSTLHTNDAAGVFPRLIDMGVEPFLVQSSVVLASAQRLLKRTCSNCKDPINVPPDVLERVQYAPLAGAPPPAFCRGRGCQQCKGSGYKGRVAVIEAMLNWPAIQEAVMRRAAGNDVKKAAMECGMRSLRQNSMDKAACGVTTIEQVLECTVADTF